MPGLTWEGQRAQESCSGLYGHSGWQASTFGRFARCFGAVHENSHLVRRVLEYERPVGPPRLFCLRLRCCTLQNRKPAAPTFLKDRAMKIYVGNLSFNTADQELTALFTPYGQVDSVRLIRDRATGQSRGFGFVEMADASAGRAACTALDQQEFEGRRLTVNEAKPQEQRSGGGGGGFGRGRDARW